MSSQELLNTCIYATVGIFAIAFLLDAITMIISCWKEAGRRIPPQIQEEVTDSQSIKPESPEITNKTASVDWVQPYEATDPVEDIDIIGIAKSKAIASTEQLAQLPINVLKAIAKSKNIRLGNSQKPETIIKKLVGNVKVCDLPVTT